MHLEIPFAEKKLFKFIVFDEEIILIFTGSEKRRFFFIFFNILCSSTLVIQILFSNMTPTYNTSNVLLHQNIVNVFKYNALIFYLFLPFSQPHLFYILFQRGAKKSCNLLKNLVYFPFGVEDTSNVDKEHKHIIGEFCFYTFYIYILYFIVFHRFLTYLSQVHFSYHYHGFSCLLQCDYF